MTDHRRNLDLFYAVDNAMAEGRFAEAEAHCRTLLQRRYMEDDIVSRLGVVLARQGKMDAAARWFRIAALLDPAQPEALGNLAHLRERTGDDAGIVAAFRWLLTVTPEDRDAAARMGDAAERAGQLDRAFAAHQSVARGGAMNAARAYQLFDALRRLRTAETGGPGRRHASMFLSHPSPLRIALVSAANEGYAGYLRGMLDSVLATAGPRPPAIRILDLGLGDTNLGWLASIGAKVVKPGWDFDFPDRAATPETFKAMSARPFLPRHFPGFDLYLWMDADTWVQDAGVLDDFLLAALLGRLAIVPEMSPAYLRHYQTLADGGARVDEQTWRRRSYALCYGEAVADALADRPTLNSGVFALRADAPHWKAWQDSLAEALRNTRFPLVEQTALNHAVYHNRLVTAPLAARANWQAHRRLPFIDPRGGYLCEPHPPHDPIGIIHVTGPDKTRRHAMLRLDGKQVDRSLLYRGAEA